MKKTSKYIFAGAAIAALIGMILVVCGITMGAKNGFLLSGGGLTLIDDEQIEEQTTDLEAFYTIRLNVDCGDVTFVPSDHYGISYTQYNNFPANYCVENGVLEFSSPFRHKRGLMLTLPSFERKSNPVTIYYPADTSFQSIKIEADFGNIAIGALQTEILDVECDLGDVVLDGVQVNDCKLTVDFGNVTLRTPIAESLYSYECETDLGEVVVNGTSLGREVKRLMPDTEYHTEIKADLGDVLLEFEQ